MQAVVVEAQASDVHHVVARSAGNHQRVGAALPVGADGGRHAGSEVDGDRVVVGATEQVDLVGERADHRIDRDGVGTALRVDADGADVGVVPAAAIDDHRRVADYDSVVAIGEREGQRVAAAAAVDRAGDDVAVADLEEVAGAAAGQILDCEVTEAAVDRPGVGAGDIPDTVDVVACQRVGKRRALQHVDAADDAADSAGRACAQVNRDTAGAAAVIQRVGAAASIQGACQRAARGGELEGVVAAGGSDVLQSLEVERVGAGDVTGAGTGESPDVVADGGMAQAVGAGAALDVQVHTRVGSRRRQPVRHVDQVEGVVATGAVERQVGDVGQVVERAVKGQRDAVDREGVARVIAGQHQDRVESGGAEGLDGLVVGDGFRTNGVGHAVQRAS